MSRHRTHLRAVEASRRWEHPAVDESWKAEARCRGEDPELWFSKKEGQRHGMKIVKAMDMVARAICSQCPVAGDCLAYALELDLRYGTWGGMTENDRAKLTGKKPGL